MAGSNVKRFTDLLVWRRSHQLFLDILKDLDGPSANRRAAWLLYEQIIRCVGSVGANIAEGFNWKANETENWLYKLRDAGFLTRDQAKPHIRETIEVGKMLAALIRSIRRQPDRQKKTG